MDLINKQDQIGIVGNRDGGRNFTMGGPDFFSQLSYII